MSARLTELVDQHPLNMIIYEAHIYFDRDNMGTYKGTYDEERVNEFVGVNRLKDLQRLAAGGQREGLPSANSAFPPTIRAG